MRPAEQRTLIETFAREEVIHQYARAHDRHLEAKLIAMHSGDVAMALEHDRAAAIVLGLYKRESYNPLPEGLG